MYFLKQKTKGSSLVELVFYISILAVLTLVVVNSLIVMAKAYRETVINRDFMQAGPIMDRMSRTIREGTGALSVSAFGPSIKVNIQNDAQIYKPVEFVLVSGNIELYENDVFIGNLNPANLTVRDLSFTFIDTSAGLAVKIAMTVQANRYPNLRSEDFYNTVALRGAY